MSPITSCTRRAHAGISLVELLVAMAIALVLTLAVANVMTHSEGAKRSTTSVSDVNQTGAYVSYVLDRAIRSAGSGYAQRWPDVLGCPINASLDNTQILPRPGAFPAPFQDVPAQLRLAPVLIAKSAGDTDSDVLIVMTGSGGFGEAGQPVRAGTVQAGQLDLYNTLGWSGDDLLLIAQQGMGCMLQQVKSPFTGSSARTLNLSGRFYSATGASVNLTSFGSGPNTTYAFKLGNATDNPPLFQMFGVGDNNTLLSYDLLRIAGDATVPIAEGVAQVRALYGVDRDRDGKLDAWVDPGTSPYDIGTLLNGSNASQSNLRSIVAVRIGLILRSSLIEADRIVDPNARRSDDPSRRFVAPESITLFGDLEDALKSTRKLSEDERKRRHRTVDVTIPLRNVLML